MPLVAAQALLVSTLVPSRLSTVSRVLQLPLERILASVLSPGKQTPDRPDGNPVVELLQIIQSKATICQFGFGLALHRGCIQMTSLVLPLSKPTARSWLSIPRECQEEMAEERERAGPQPASESAGRCPEPKEAAYLSTGAVSRLRC